MAYKDGWVAATAHFPNQEYNISGSIAEDRDSAVDIGKRMVQHAEEWAAETSRESEREYYGEEYEEEE